MTTTPAVPASDTTDRLEVTQEALLAEIHALAVTVRRADRTIQEQVGAAAATELDGVTPISRQAAYVSSANLMKHGWSVKTYLPQVQVDGLLNAMRAGRRAEVREVIDWLDKDAAGTAPSGRTLPLELHPTIARAVAAPLRAWMKLQAAMDQVTTEENVLNALTTTTPTTPRRRPGR